MHDSSFACLAQWYDIRALQSCVRALRPGGQCRPKGQVMGLLDLPTEVLCVILSFLGTLSLAAVRLTCRDLREAAISGRKRLVFEVGSCYKAKACALRRVLRSMHIFQSSMNLWKEEQRRADATSSTAPDRPAFKRFRQFLQTQLLVDVAQEVEFLDICESWLDHHEEWNPGMCKLLCGPRVLLPAMQRLRSLILCCDDTAILDLLPALQQLTHVRWPDCGNGAIQMADLQKVCSLPMLASLDLWPAAITGTMYFQKVLEVVAHGKASGMRNLVLPCPAGEVHHLSILTALTALTALVLHFEGSSTLSHLGGVASLTGLKSLRMGFDLDERMAEPVIETLSPLTALMGLTLLGLNDGYQSDWDCDVPADISVLSCLTALRVLRCNLNREAKFFARDPIPVQLRVLRLATGLEELSLVLEGPSWSLSDVSYCALMREGVSALKSLKRVALKIFKGDSAQSCAFLRLFGTVSSLEAFWFEVHNWQDPDPLPALGFTASQAVACFHPLTLLRSLVLLDDNGTTGHAELIPHCADLLAGLPGPSTRLTRLHLTVQATDVPTMQQVARFRDLQELKLRSFFTEPQTSGPTVQLKMCHLPEPGHAYAP